MVKGHWVAWMCQAWLTCFGWWSNMLSTQTKTKASHSVCCKYKALLYHSCWPCASISTPVLYHISCQLNWIFLASPTESVCSYCRMQFIHNNILIFWRLSARCFFSPNEKEFKIWLWERISICDFNFKSSLCINHNKAVMNWFKQMSATCCWVFQADLWYSMSRLQILLNHITQRATQISSHS